MKSCSLMALLCLTLGACSKPATPPAVVATPEALKAHSAEFKKEVLTPAPGVHVAIGYGIANAILIEGDGGALLIDTTESLEAAKEVAAAFALKTTQPVRAIIYTHSHPDHVQGAAAFMPAGVAVPIYAHEDVAANMDKIASELQPVITRRSLRMYGHGLSPDELINLGIGPELAVHEGTTLGIARPTRTFRDTLEDTVAGIRFTLVHAPGETDDQIFVWLPDRKILLPGDNIYKAFPNLYTIRGTGYRDPKRWAASIDKMRRLSPELLLPSHTRPIAGKDEIARVLTDYRDAIRYVYDQTMRAMNRGLLPDEVAATLKLPAHLAASPYLQEFYGRPGWSAKSIFTGNLGWYDGDPATLTPLPPLERSQRMVQLAGGEAAFNQAIEAAGKNNEHAWVLELSSHALRVNAGNAAAKQARLAALKALGEGESNPNARHYYLVSYHELNGDYSVPSRAVSPTPEMLAAMPLSVFFDGLAVNLDDEKAGDKTMTVRFEFTDVDEQWHYLLRRGVSEVLPPKDAGFAPTPDLVVRVKAQVFKEMMAQLRKPA
ncbi:MAG: alkyl sulfatase dimerization domain-containing protein, partial [Pseudomonadota bacterium]